MRERDSSISIQLMCAANIILVSGCPGNIKVLGNSSVRSDLIKFRLRGR